MGGQTKARPLQHAGCAGAEVNSEVRGQKSEVGELAFVALGSNLGDSRQTIRQAMDRLQDLSVRPLLKSSLWRTNPVDCPPGSPVFVNAVVGLVTSPGATPELLLSKLQAIEKEFGRQAKKAPNEPRPLDLDLITFGTRAGATDQLTLPHPRAHQRRFVLQPLSEFAPELILPGQSKSVAELLAELSSDETVQRL